MGISLWFSATFVKGNKFSDFLFALSDYEDILNPFALRKAKIVPYTILAFLSAIGLKGVYSLLDC